MLVEATFRKDYGLTVREIFEMPWRQFRVLFEHSFTRGESEGNAEGDFDWNAELDKSMGRETPTNVVKMDLAEFSGLV